MTSLREQAEKAMVWTAPRLPAPVLRVIGGRPPRIDGEDLHPQVQLAVRLESMLGGSRILPVAEKRAQRRRDARLFAGPRIEVARTEDLEIPTDAGPVRARL